MTYFQSRKEAGQFLAEKLLPKREDDPVVYAISKGALPVAYEVARRLQAPLDLLFEKRGPRRKTPSCQDRTILLVDDGAVTESSLSASITQLRLQNPKRIIFVTPLISNEILANRQDVDETIFLSAPEPFYSAANWYHDFAQVTDEEVARFMEDKAYPLNPTEQEIEFHDGPVCLRAVLNTVEDMMGLIVFSLGGESSRKNKQCQFLSSELNKMGFATLLTDILSEEEALDRKNIFAIELQASRLLKATEVGLHQIPLRDVPIGYFGLNLGVGAALAASAKCYRNVFSVVCYGGRPDLAVDYFSKVHAPVLLLVEEKDHQLLPVNEKAAKNMSLAKLALTQGTNLNEVVEYSTEWFLRFTPKKRTIESPKENIVREIEKRAHPVKNEGAWNDLIQEVAQARIVMLGEATHGSAEFYSVRRMITEKLIRDHGFDFVAVEGDWPDCQKLNEYIHKGEGKSAKEIMRRFHRWPTWMWANDEAATLIEWMQSYQASFYGLDVYSFFESMDYVNHYVEKLDPDLAQAVRTRYSCFDSFGKNEKSYARQLVKFEKGCRDEVAANLQDLLRVRLDIDGAKNGDLFNAQQNARIVKNAENYYRTMLSGGPESWNVRDQHMMETLEILLNRHSGKSKCIVWAHNTHIGDYHATDMLEQGYVNLGGLARERFGADQVALVGFGTYQGQVLASPAWGGPETLTPLAPGRESSFEFYCHKVAKDLESPRFYLLLDAEARKSVLGVRQYGHRAVGVVYDPRDEIHGRNYVPTSLAKRYDAFVFIDKTSALRSIPTMKDQRELPATWPGGI